MISTTTASAHLDLLMKTPLNARRSLGFYADRLELLQEIHRSLSEDAHPDIQACEVCIVQVQIFCALENALHANPAVTETAMRKRLLSNFQHQGYFDVMPSINLRHYGNIVEGALKDWFTTAQAKTTSTEETVEDAPKSKFHRSPLKITMKSVAIVGVTFVVVCTTSYMIGKALRS